MALAMLAHRAGMMAELQKRRPLPIGPYEGSLDKQVNVQATIGAENIGIWIAQCVYGMNLVQSIRYWNHFRNDHILMKSTVAVLMVLDFAGVVAYIRLVYFWDVLSWGNVYALNVLDWSFFMDIFLTGLVPAIVQWYFVWRVYAISGKKARIMPAIIVLCSFCGIAFSTVVMVGVWEQGTPDKINNWLWGVETWFIASCIGDALITINMLYYLSRARQATRFSKTRGVLNRFIILVFETNAITFLGALGVLILFAWGNQKTLAYNALTYVVTKVYFLSLLLATNLRIDLREYNNSTSGVMELSGSDSGPSAWGRAASSSTNRGNLPSLAQAVKVTSTSTVEEEDARKMDLEARYSPPSSPPMIRPIMNVAYPATREPPRVQVVGSIAEAFGDRRAQDVQTPSATSQAEDLESKANRQYSWS